MTEENKHRDQANLDRMPYQLPFPAEAQSEIVVSSLMPEQENVWVPQMDNVLVPASLPQCFARLLGQPIACLQIGYFKPA